MKLQEFLGQIGVVYNVIFNLFEGLSAAIYHLIMKDMVIFKLFDINIDDLELKKKDEDKK